MKRKHSQTMLKRLLLLSLPAMMLAACSSPSAAQPAGNDKTAQNEQRPDGQKPGASNSTQNASDSEEKNDDLELDNLETVTSTSIDLSKAANGQLIDSAGTYTLSGKGSCTVVVDAKNADVTLKLDGIELNTADTPAIYVRNAKSVVLELDGTNKLNSSHPASGDLSALNAAIYSRTETTLKGDGSLNISDEDGHGLKSKDDLHIESGSYAFTVGQDGFHASDNLDVKDGTFDLTCGDEGFEVNEIAVFEKGSCTIDSEGDGIRADGDLSIKDGTYTITTRNEGLESKAALLIEQGTIDIDSSDDCINAANSLTVKGGSLDLLSQTNDCIDSNGTLDLAGGTIHATALRAPEGAFDTDNAAFTISGGTIVGLSATATMPTQSDQNTVMIAAEPFQTLELKQDGKTLISFDMDENASASMSSITLTLSCKDLKAGSEAELLLDGKSAESFTVEEGLTTVGNISTMGGGPGGGMRGDFENGERPQMPNGEMPDGEMPDFENGERPQMPNGEMPEDFDPSNRDQGGRGPRPNDRQNKNNEDAQSGATQNAGGSSSDSSSLV